MIDRDHDLPVKRQAELLCISRGSAYDHPEAIPEAELALMRRIDELHLEHPFAGSRMLPRRPPPVPPTIGRPCVPRTS